MTFEQVFFRLVRLGGFAGAMYEVFVDNIDRPAVLALLGAMMGLADRQIKKADER